MDSIGIVPVPWKKEVAAALLLTFWAKAGAMRPKKEAKIRRMGKVRLKMGNTFEKK